MARTLVINKIRAGGREFEVNEELQISSTLKKFLVHFRRPINYQGEYGFDWLRDEYIYPIKKVTNDNNGATIGIKTPLCKNPEALKDEYNKPKKDVNPIVPYGKNYYPAWLSIFPHTTTAQFAHGSRMHDKGITLDLEIEQLEALVHDDTKLIFESSDSNLVITPDKIDLKTLIGNKQIKDLGGNNRREFYHVRGAVNIQSKDKPLTRHTEIKVFAQLKNQKEQVGKLMVYKNDMIPKAKIVVVNVITGNIQASLRNDYQFLFKKQSFNQALVRAEVVALEVLNLSRLVSYNDVAHFLSNYSSMSADNIRENIETLYQKYGRHRPPTGQIDDNSNTQTYLFYTDIQQGRTAGICSLDSQTNVWGNHYVVFNAGLSSKRTVIHECGHSFSLPHIFSDSMSSFKFYQGYTDNYMDYEWQKGNPVDPNDLSKGFYSSGDNIFKNNMYSLFKWQWDILRSDRSLITNY
ncbi:hypothetical protein [Sinomicrobium sp. M5D2P17]